MNPERRCAPRRGLRCLGARSARALLVTVLASLATAAAADRAGAQMMLYEDRLPDGYAYVRFANATPDGVALKPVGFADPLTLGTNGADRVSAYYVVEGVAGRTLSVEAGGGQLRFELKPMAFHTVLIDGVGGERRPKVVTDQVELSQTKARLAFYNAAPSCAAAGLYLEPKGQAVLTEVMPNFMRGRIVNPAPNPRMRATCGPTRVAEVELGPLDAGGQYSIWLIAPGGTPTAFLSKNKIAPFLR